MSFGLAAAGDIPSGLNLLNVRQVFNARWKLERVILGFKNWGTYVCKKQSRAQIRQTCFELLKYYSVTFKPNKVSAFFRTLMIKEHYWESTVTPACRTYFPTWKHFRCIKLVNFFVDFVCSSHRVYCPILLTQVRWPLSDGARLFKNSAITFVSLCSALNSLMQYFKRFCWALFQRVSRFRRTALDGAMRTEVAHRGRIRIR